MNGAKKLKIFIIAGEKSGDKLGGKLMQALRTASAEPIKFAGIGGEDMEKAGLTSLFPMQNLTMMGFFEILPHIPKFLRLIKQTVTAAVAFAPDIVITIDSPGFCVRVAKRLKDLNTPTKLIHYVAPSVWAYKPGRAAKMAQIYDHLLALLPFEPPYFLAENLSTDFVGHPIIEDVQPAKISERRNQLILMPGSREGEIQRLLPIFLAAAERLANKIDQLEILILATNVTLERVVKQTASNSLKIQVITSEEEKAKALASARIGLIKSGTASLEVATSGLPMIVAYRVNPLSAWLLRRMIKVRYVSLVNLLAGAEVIPEFLQEQCTAENLADALYDLWVSPEKQQTQTNLCAQNIAKLAPSNGGRPSEVAAQCVLSLQIQRH